MKMLGIIFSNIYDGEMGELTKNRTVASLPFGGRYRQIDFVLSNMVNSGITSVGVITKYNYQSLMDHFGDGSEWDLNRKNDGLFILPPFASGNTGVYKGKLEALNSALSFLRRSKYKYVLMCDSTVICNIDFEEVLNSHIKSGADITVVANKDYQNKNNVNNELILKVVRNRVIDMAVNTIVSDGEYTGMGMYIMDRKSLISVIEYSVSHGLCHFEKDFLQRRFITGDFNINVYKFKDCVLRNKSVASYFKNNLSLTSEKTQKGIFKPDAPIYTKVRDEAPTYYAKGCSVDDCIIADGCNIKGSIKNSVIFRDVVIEEGAIVHNCVLMQGTKIGKNARLVNVITDKDVTVTEDTVLSGAEMSPLIIGKGKIV